MPRKEEVETEDDDDSEEEESSEESECDYKLNSDKINQLCKKGISKARAQDLWTRQRGCCAISGMNMTWEDNIYSVTVVKRRGNSEISDKNSWLVCRVVQLMKNGSQLNWTQFKSVVVNVANGIDQ